MQNLSVKTDKFFHWVLLEDDPKEDNGLSSESSFYKIFRTTPIFSAFPTYIQNSSNDSLPISLKGILSDRKLQQQQQKKQETS
jgi:hypothetical protein